MGVHGRRPTPRGFMTMSAISDFKDIAHYGAVAYCAEGANLQGWKCGRKCQTPVIQSSTLHSVINVEGSFAFIALRPSHSQIVVTIRGTKTLENWWDNLTGLKRSPLPVYLTNLTQAEGGQDATVHSGFVDSYRPLRAPLQLALRTLLQGLSPAANTSDWSLVFTGHSLGGAVATLAALDLAAADFAVERSRIRLVSFGMPRMGNVQFANLVDRVLAGRVARVVEENDLEPHLPPMWSGYRHFSGERYVTGEQGARSVKACVGQEDDTCSNARVPWLSKDRHGGLLGASGWFAKQTC
ncbi:Alpha/Beta hydrolase protein [Catenaria anguillulae PL171]|uniref:Alpha/Beta hydrolase protein n=1 Tax=Catenaria anguillulae PL171 TaxID=765915 RepID=A0A1Y2H9P1_9FUNG|nr:Alpha/Beta hydrolase protein [Catenaria anguillulae PL171]